MTHWLQFFLGTPAARPVYLRSSILFFLVDCSFTLLQSMQQNGCHIVFYCTINEIPFSGAEMYTLNGEILLLKPKCLAANKLFILAVSITDLCLESNKWGPVRMSVICDSWSYPLLAATTQLLETGMKNHIHTGSWIHFTFWSKKKRAVTSIRWESWLY